MTEGSFSLPRRPLHQLRWFPSPANAGADKGFPDRPAAEQGDDREQDDRADQRIEESLDRDRVVEAPAEQKAGDDRADDSDDDVEDDALLGVGPHDKARKPAANASDNQPDDDTHERFLLFCGGRRARGCRSGITDA